VEVVPGVDAVVRVLSIPYRTVSTVSTNVEGGIPVPPIPVPLPAVIWLRMTSTRTPTPADWHAETIAPNWSRFPRLLTSWCETGWYDVHHWLPVMCSAAGET
jgi:hypothetical protein